MQIQFMLWDRIVAAIKRDIPQFKTINKKDSKLSKIIAKVLFFTNYMQFFTTRYPNVYLPDRPIHLQRNPRVLQHEWVHLLDQQTFFGLLPFMPAKINYAMFAVAYLMPQLLALLALLAIWNPWWLLCLAFLAPIPAPGRMIAELRAYRRSRETGGEVRALVKKFSDSSYYFMWPFKKHVAKLLLKDSPYKEKMDKAQVGE